MRRWPLLCPAAMFTGGLLALGLMLGVAAVFLTRRVGDPERHEERGRARAWALLAVFGAGTLGIAAVLLDAAAHGVRWIPQAILGVSWIALRALTRSARSAKQVRAGASAALVGIALAAAVRLLHVY